jgi:integrin alpha FG-GAP repeat containing protein 1
MVLYVVICSLALISLARASDITYNVFGSKTDVLPAAFGDFNSDEYPDLFVISNHQKAVEILLGSDTEPLFKRSPNLKCDFNNKVTSVVPGDYDGDGLLDVLVTVAETELNNVVHILWGGLDRLNCSDMHVKYLTLKGQPLAMDHNQDMIIDLFGANKEGKRTFWLFNKNRTAPEEIDMLEGANYKFSDLKIPHSHSFLDLNNDSFADLYVSSEDNYEVWLYQKESKSFQFSNMIRRPHSGIKHLGQTLFLDVELKGKIDHLVPVCFTSDCSNSTIYVYSLGNWYNLKLNFHNDGAVWGFVPPEDGKIFLDTITLRGGDFNMDGYPDLLATLQNTGHRRSYLLENIECTTNCNGFSRTFAVRWTALNPYNNNTILGVFYDFAQDGVLDIVFVHDKPKLNVSAFKNSLDYDANFIKVMVLTGKTNKEHPVVPTPLGRKRRTYGTSVPGPIISYKTTTQEGVARAAQATQLPQSAYFCLHLPYTLFGLGRTPNFVDNLSVGVNGLNRSWTQIIPNSQMVVIPTPADDSLRWTAQLFVTPSKLILQSVVALLGTCLLISIIIIILYWKERREDHYEKLQEAHRFHFDAM